jgi:hypothetical protein
MRQEIPQRWMQFALSFENMIWVKMSAMVLVRLVRSMKVLLETFWKHGLKCIACIHETVALVLRLTLFSRPFAISSVPHALQGNMWWLANKSQSKETDDKDGTNLSPIQSDKRNSSRLSVGGAQLSTEAQPYGDAVESSFRSISSESSEEDSCDSAFLRRHLPYEICEREHSIRVYADESGVGMGASPHASESTYPHSCCHASTLDAFSFMSCTRNTSKENSTNLSSSTSSATYAEAVGDSQEGRYEAAATPSGMRRKPPATPSGTRRVLIQLMPSSSPAAHALPARGLLVVHGNAGDDLAKIKDAQQSEEELAGGVAGRLGCIALNAHSLATLDSAECARTCYARHTPPPGGVWQEECGKENWLKGIQGSAALRNAHHILSMQRP